jgi:hypothetical protein
MIRFSVDCYASDKRIRIALALIKRLQENPIGLTLAEPKNNGDITDKLKNSRFQRTQYIRILTNYNELLDGLEEAGLDTDDVMEVGH